MPEGGGVGIKRWDIMAEVVEQAALEEVVKPPDFILNVTVVLV